MTDPDVSGLYRGAPEDFIAARDALVKRLRDEGREAEAAEVKSLRRPTVAAWALDALATDAPEEIAALLNAGAELARAQRAALSGRDPQALHDASAARRELVATLTELAADALRAAGRAPDPHLEDIRGTLEAASVDEDVADRLRTGTLDRTVQPSAGFGDLTGLQLVSRRDELPAAEPTGKREPALATDEVRARELEAEIRRLRRDRDAAERKAAAADETRARLAEQVTSMHGRLDAATSKLRDAEAVASEQRMIAKRAVKAFETAERKRAKRG